MTTALNPRHQANIVAKAERALTAIDSLIHTRLIIDPDIPEVVNLPTGRVFMLDALQGDPLDTAGWWVSVGLELDRLAEVKLYGRRCRPTNFATSRQTILDMLDGRVWADAHPEIDPFDGIGF